MGNRTWKNEFIRRAHLDVVDVRDKRSLDEIHLCLMYINKWWTQYMVLILSQVKMLQQVLTILVITKKNAPKSSLKNETKWYK